MDSFQAIMRKIVSLLTLVRETPNNILNVIPGSSYLRIIVNNEGSSVSCSKFTVDPLLPAKKKIKLYLLNFGDMIIANNRPDIGR